MVTLKDFFSFKRNRFFWMNLIAMVAVVIVACMATLWWLDSYTRHGEAYTVPFVKNKSIDEAQRMLASQHMKGVVIDSSYVKDAPAGIVLEQKPEGGSHVKEGRTIYLTLSTNNVPLVKVPDLVENSSMRQAEARLKSMGFKLTEPEYVAGQQDWVYGIKYRGQDLQAGDKVPYEALLTLCIGSSDVCDSLAVDSLDIENGTSADEPKIDDSWF